MTTRNLVMRQRSCFRTNYKPNVTCYHSRQKDRPKMPVQNPPQVSVRAVAALVMTLGTTNITVPSAFASDSLTYREELEYRSSKSQPGNIPAQLSADDDPNDGNTYKYAPPPKVKESIPLGQRLERWRESKGFTRNLLEYLAIALVAWRYQAARKPDATAQRLGVWDQESAKALVGTRWKLTLDVGREVGTWMPANWAASGRRIEIPCAVSLEEDGVVRALGVGAYIKLELGEGTWNVDGDTLRFNLQISGFQRGDISLPEGKLYFKNYAWGNTMSQTKGKLLLMQRRALIRREWRTVGSFKAEQIPGGEGVDGPLNIPAARVKEGDVVFPTDAGF
eukprot:CAMPEP_0198199816 /NCGR_PEP_ID=MMETSP1445-20131203/2970_1 /TAXON_ID=36898 /ORGANISM="Pyramimonas sp., Strain CCMP2087" /LENGTH=335 /DNA_ID=CAMNT_0043869717 /DNA_START=143 /DNA_END=1150 /DNA_ORIENTATION=+